MIFTCALAVWFVWIQINLVKTIGVLADCLRDLKAKEDKLE
jgi:hypothetical protein